MSVRSDLIQVLILPKLLAILKCFHGCSATTHFPLVRSDGIVKNKPRIQIGLQLLNTCIQLFAKAYLVELLQHGFMEPLAHAVGLRRSGFGFGMIDIVDCQIELIVMRFRLAAIFGATVSQDADNAHALFGKEWQYTVVEQIGGGNWRFGCVELGHSHFAVGIDEGLLVDAANAFDRPDVERIL